MVQGVKGGDNKQANADEDEDHESSEYNQMQQILKQFIEQSSIIQSLFRFLQIAIFSHEKSAATIITRYENLYELLYKSTIAVENFQIRSEVLKRIKEIVLLRSMS